MKLAESSVLEDKIGKLISEVQFIQLLINALSCPQKAKADNKYFATMRIKDQLEHEKKTLARTLEKQNKVIEKYADSESSLNIRVVCAVR